MASSLLTNIVVQPYHATLEIIHLISQNIKPILRFSLVAYIAFGLGSFLGYYHLLLSCSKWIGLGILSSVGFGFGMHTFVLFLAPHIAAVTLAAHNCQSLNFPEPPYPDRIICPDNQNHDKITFSDVLLKVSLESFMWGMGTAIGELPPYLAARLRSQAINRGFGGDSIDTEHKAANWEIWMIRIINKIGFFGILLCAAIPNPLFDAAGVASGIAQVPFLTFFGATFIGKAMIKVFIQTAFVIFTFHNNNLDLILQQVDQKIYSLLPIFKKLDAHKVLATFIQDQRIKVLTKQSDNSGSSSTVSALFEWLIRLMMTLFVISVINALHKQYMERKARQIKKD